MSALASPGLTMNSPPSRTQVMTRMRRLMITPAGICACADFSRPANDARPTTSSRSRVVRPLDARYSLSRNMWNGLRWGGSKMISFCYLPGKGDWDIRAQLRTLRVPTLVVHGEEETIPMDLVEEWVTSLPQARLFKVPRAAHFTYAERPELVWPEVEAFLGVRANSYGHRLVSES